MFIAPGKEVQADPIGVYFIRGDNVAVIGEIDIKLEEAIDYSTLKAGPIKPIVTH